MATPWRTLRVFISSTFRDMHSERDYLVRVVFPELRERCAKRRLHLVDVDLRWGVTEEEAERGRVLEICLDEIKRCRPFFAGILGERYGSVLPRAAAPDDPSYDWLRELDQEHSVTALEIYHGVLRNPGLKTRSFFYFRDPAFLSSVPTELREAFLAESEEAAQKLAALKNQIRRQCPVFENYPCRYAGQSDGRVILSGLEAFGQRVLDDLWSAISEEYPEETSPPDELEIERSFHEAFIESRVHRFIGRADLLEQMRQYADGGGPAPLVVAGAAGSGKSAVLAKFAFEYARDHAETFLLSHFIGASPGSTDIRRTLLRLCGDINRRQGIDSKVPEDFQELWQEFLKSLERAGRTGKVLLVIDALNQLDDRHDPQALHWLPSTLPPGVRVIVSTLDGDFLKALRRRRPAPQEIIVAALSDDERRALVRQTLWDYRKRLDERAENDQMGRLLAKAEADNPLYLVIACEELRLFGEFERVTARIEALPDDTERLLDQVLERLEVDLGAELVRDALSLLECSRQGLLEIEMLELLRRDDEEQLPRAVWARLYRGLRFYLRPAGEAGEGLLDFFHRQLAKAVRNRYLTTATEPLVHARLARFFRQKIDPLGDRGWKRVYPRGLSELPHHLLHAAMYDDLFALARDKSFLDTVAGVFAEDPQLSLEALQKAIEAAARLDHAGRMAEFVLQHAHRRAGVAQESPFEALRRAQLERAWELADIHPPERCALWHLLLAWDLKDAGRLDEARATLERLSQRELPRMRHAYWWSRCAVPLLSHTVDVSEALFQTLQQRLLEDDARLDLCKEVAAAGHIAVARAAADGIANEYKRRGAHHMIARAQVEIAAGRAQAGDFTGAMETAREIADDWHRAMALREIGSAQAEAGLHDAACTSLASAVELCERNLETLRTIAVRQARAGCIEDARVTFRAAADAAREHLDRSFGEEQFAGVVAALAEAGEIETALELSGEIPSDWRKGQALYAVAAAQLRLGYGSAALATARAISDFTERMKALNLVALTQVRAGEAERGRAAFDEAREVALLVSDFRDGANGLREVALAEMQAGLQDDARATFERAIEDIRDKHNDAKLRYLATTLAQAEELDLAIRIANQIRDDADRVRALAAVASERAKAGDQAAARNLLNELEEQAAALPLPGSRTGAFHSIARALVDNQDFTAAVAVIQRAKDSGWEAAEAIVYGVFGYPASFYHEDTRRVQDPGRAREIVAGLLNAMLKGETTNEEARAIALSELVKAQVEAGDAEGALKTARRVPKGFYLERSLSAAAVAQACAGAFDRAFEIADEIPEERPRDDARGAIAAELARVRQFDRAVEIAGDLGEWERGPAFFQIAVAMAETGEFDRAVEITSDEDGQPDRMVLLECATAQVAAGDLEAACATFGRLVQSAQAQSWYYVNVFLSDIADRQAKAGFQSEARETLLLARDAALGASHAADLQAAEELIETAEKQANFGFVGDALETVRLMRARHGAWKCGRALVAIAIAQAAAGGFADARETASKIEHRRELVKALSHIALAEARAGMPETADADLKEAVTVALEGVERDEDKDRAVGCLADVAVAQQDAGLTDAAEITIGRALESARGIASDNDRSRALQAIAVARARLVDFAGAQQTLEEIVFEIDRRSAQAKIAAVQAHAGLGAEALRTAEGGLVERAKLFEELAQVFAETGDREDFKRLLLPCAQESSSAHRLCVLLARMYPEQLAAVTEAVVRADREL